MPFCRCGELSNEDKCKKCGYNLLSSSTDNRRSMIDRWQSRYLGSIVGLDSISPSAKDDTNNNKRIPFSPISQRATSIYKDLTNPLSSLLDHRRSKLCELKSKDLFASPSEQPATEKPENSCQECYKKLSGKLVRIPNSQVRYHWSCLKCESCKGVFENTSFIIDSSKKVYHPKCALFLSPSTTCSRCSLVISEKYIAVNSSVLHLKCFRCTGCQKVLQPSSIYTDDQGYFCQHCTNNKPVCDQEQLSKYMKIVPQPQTISKNSSSTMFDNSLLYEDNLSDTASVSSDSDLIDSYSKMSVSTPKSRYSYSPANRRVAPKSDVVKPSSLMSSRGRPLPRFGVVRDCPRCNERIDSVHDEIPGPKASRWHKKCLSCTGCSKMLDSGTNVQEDRATGRLNPWCTTCILNKKDRKGPVMTKV
ncbi:hypothetical protein CU098_012061 [Rhizopus stolonifer]|uniref:LIM zinc-binding domain-containing protein n=1 Tax=Rhizopus stolonifer TaxID=4846 RepID=A0A367KRA7_RHIST|nr:hypothetical protein CU098_012061 [Rhizopus stolonifer]